MQNHIATDNPTLFFGRTAPSYYPPGRHTGYLNGGPYVFRLRVRSEPGSPTLPSDS
jgi:hypothetical protein